MSKFHITTILRVPRRHLKSIEAPPASTATSEATEKQQQNNSHRSQLELQQLEFDETATETTELTTTTTTTQGASSNANSNQSKVNHVEFIPTLNFTSNKPQAIRSTKQQNVAAACANLDQSVDTVDHSTNSTEEYTNTSFEASQHIAKESDNSEEGFLPQPESDLIESDQSTSLTDIQELLKSLHEAQELHDQHFSLSSYFDEPTSSISIEMASYGTSNTINTTTTASSTSSRPIDSSIRITNSDESIEEEIEEDIEISEEIESATKGTEPKSAELNVFASTSKAAFKPTITLKSHQSSDEGQFEIDDEQLTGGKIAQHFVLEDDDDEDDDDDNDNVDADEDDGEGDSKARSVSLKAADRGNSQRETTPSVHESLEKISKPRDESTADDVSDFLEDANNEDNDEDVELSSEDIEPPLPSDKSNTNDNKTVEQLTSASPEFSEKNNSIDEIIASNYSVVFEISDVNERKESAKESNLNESEVATSTNVSLKKLSSESQVEGPLQPIESGIENVTELKDPSGATEEMNEHMKVESIERAFSKTQSEEFTAKSFQDNHVSEIVASDFGEPLDQKKHLITDLDDSNEQDENKRDCEYDDQQIEELVTSFSNDEKLEINNDDDEDEDEEKSLALLKLHILAMQHQQQQQSKEGTSPTPDATNSGISVTDLPIKPMERVPLTEFSKDILEDITEESERNSISNATNNPENSNLEQEEDTSQSEEKSASKAVEATLTATATPTTSIVSLNMLKMLEQRVLDLQELLASKDACLSALNLQLEANNTLQQNRERNLLQLRRDSNGNNNNNNTNNNNNSQPCSGRETSSIATNSTEYRTLQEDVGATTDFYVELNKRDELINKLTESLQHSLNAREQLQLESERLNNEIQLMRKQLNEVAFDGQRRGVYWPRADQESNCGQRISEISMDLVSESDDDLERNFLTDNEEKYQSRNSRERQLSLPRSEASELDLLGMVPSDMLIFSRQIELFQNYLTPSENRTFRMVKKKFDDFLSQELEKCCQKCESELKITLDKLNNEKNEQAAVIKRLQQAQQERIEVHSKEMEDLRKYFETKCADLEKQYSDDVFSQKSRQGEDSVSSECSSDAEQHMPDDFAANSVLGNLVSSAIGSKESSPRKRTRAELLLSPSHRQMTPGSEEIGGQQAAIKELAEVKSFYQSKIQEQQRSYELRLRQLNEKVKYFESRYPEDAFMDPTTVVVPATSSETLNRTLDSDQLQITGTTDTTHDSQIPTAPKQTPNASLIIIDQDELNANQNESQIIQKIVEEYEKRLQEQIVLARQDIVIELEKKIQNLLSEATTDDLHWPPELILLREKLTAKSQLEIAQLQMKHEEDMSRLKLDYDKQLQRQKNMRRSIHDEGHGTLLTQVCNERDQLRQLLKSFHHTLSGLAKCVEGCEVDINATLNEQLQRLIMNASFDEQLQHGFENPQQTPTSADLHLNINGSILNSSFNSICKRLPDLQKLREVVDDPTLFEFVHSNGDDNELAEKFDVKECLERLNEEANYLLKLTTQRKLASHEEKVDVGCDALAFGLKSPNPKMPIKQTQQGTVRAEFLSEDTLAAGDASLAQYVNALNLNSMPADFQYICNNNNNETPNSVSTTPGQNPYAVLTEIQKLKKRLTESESDRRKLQDELENTISRNAELGQELQSLRDRISQLNSTEYVEGFGMVATTKASIENFAQLQERARHILYTPNAAHTSSQSEQEGDDTQDAHNYTAVLLQMIEDFCRESDRIIEANKQERDDLQAKIDAADKKLKADRKYIEEQVIEREQDERERQELTQQIEQLKREKEKEAQHLEQKTRELEHVFIQLDSQKEEISKLTKLRDDSKNKIFELREIIEGLEDHVKKLEHSEEFLIMKNKELQALIDHQNHSNEALYNDVVSLKSEIDLSYQERMRMEQKLQSIRPAAEQSAVMEQVVEELYNIEVMLDQKTKTLESLHHSSSSNSCSHSATEDISAQGGIAGASAQAAHLNLPLQPTSSPVHPSPRQHSLTMEGVQRISEKLAKHTRVEEAALKRVRDLEMQVSQMCTACVELQQERNSLQERMSEQSQRISALQTRLDEQRQRAEDLQRSGNSDLNIRVHDLQSEVRDLNEKLNVRDKQMTSLRQQLEQSKNIILRLEAELAVQQQPDRSTIEKLEQELVQKQQEIQKLKHTIKNEMINKQHLPDLMETMLADKNDEIDLLKEQFELKLKEMRKELENNISRSSSLQSNRNDGNEDAGGDDNEALKPNKDRDQEEYSAKQSARTLSDIVSIAEYDEPDVLRRAATTTNQSTPFILVNRSADTSKEAVANLTGKRTEDLTGFSQLPSANTFDNPRYFHDAPSSVKSGLLSLSEAGAPTPPQFQPRQINFSDLTDDSKLKTPGKNLELEAQLKSLGEELQTVRTKLKDANEHIAADQATIVELKAENEQLLLTRESQMELLTKHEKDLLNLRENEQSLAQRVKQLECELVQAHESATQDCAKINQKLEQLQETHANCAKVLTQHKSENEQLNSQLNIKEERLNDLCVQIAKSNNEITTMQKRLESTEQELERLRLQLNSENSSKLFSVEEIAQQVEKELNYSVQLDSNILKAIESEEENNLDRTQFNKANQTSQVCEVNPQQQEEIAIQQCTDDENFMSERDLLNQIEALKAQICVERDRNEAMRKELLAEKQHSQDVQEQDIAVLSALRIRLEKAIEQEDELHKQLDLERERYECLNAQYTALQRAESRRNSAMLLKSPTDSPRKSALKTAGERTARSLGEFETDLAERLRTEIKLLTAQNERERERSMDLQRSCEREFERCKTELSERKEYCEQINREMHKLQREKDNALQECEHLQERLTLQSKEIESLEWRLAALQEAEAQRTARRERQQKDNAQLLAEVQELKSQALTTETEKLAIQKLATQLRYDLERSNERERKLVEALAQSRENYTATTSAPLPSTTEHVPLKLLQNEIEVKRQMAETLQLLTEERCQLQQKCSDMEQQLDNRVTVQELEERCKQLLGRYLRIESHRKALAYQKHYLAVRLHSYEAGERYLAVMHGVLEDEGDPNACKKRKKKLFRTVAIAAIAIHRMKFIVNVWRSGKRIVSKSTFTITQQKRSPIQSIAMPYSTAIGSATTQTLPPAATAAATSPQITTVPDSLRLLNIHEGFVDFKSKHNDNIKANSPFNHGKNNIRSNNNNNNGRIKRGAAKSTANTKIKNDH